MDWKFIRKILSYFLAWLMVNFSGAPPTFAKGKSDVCQAEEVKAAILKLGAGKDARVILILRDGERLGGYIHQTQEDGFSVRNFCSGNVIPVSFAQVRGLRGLNVATGTQVSAGKGVSDKSVAGLTAHDPCTTTIIRARGRRSSPLRTVVLVAALATLGIVITFLIIAAVQEHNA